RGMAHSNQVREFIMTPNGVQLRDAYVGPEGVLTGSARLAQEAKDNAASLVRAQESQRRSRELERKPREITAQIEALQAQLASEVDEEVLLRREGSAREDELAADRVAMGQSRQAPQAPTDSVARLKKRSEKP